MKNNWTLLLVILTVLTGAQHAISQPRELKLAFVIGLLRNEKRAWPNMLCTFLFSFSLPAVK